MEPKNDPKLVTPANPPEADKSRSPGFLKGLDSPSTAGCENWPLQPAAQGGEPVEPRFLSASSGFAAMTNKTNN